jgi:predicted Zn-dependent protease
VIRISIIALWILPLSCRGETAHLSPKVPGSRVYFVPLGGFSHEAADEMVRYFDSRFGLKISIADDVAITSDAIDSKRDQAVAERVIVGMRNSLPTLTRDPNVILIGLTSVDIYPASVNWRFAFGWRMVAARAAIVSTARMNLHYSGQPYWKSSEKIRLRKILLKDIGILYYGMPQSDNPKSVLYRSILGIQERDSVGEDF